MFHYLHVAATIAGLTLQLFGYAESKSLKGQVMSVTESQVMVQQGTETVTLFVSKDTRVSLNGKDAKVSDLKMGDMAEVSAEENGDRTFKALTIKATRSEKQPAVPR
jgi:hypothetical protein